MDNIISDDFQLRVSNGSINNTIFVIDVVTKNFTIIFEIEGYLNNNTRTRDFILSLDDNVCPILGEAGGMIHIAYLSGHEQRYKMMYVKPKVKFTPNAVKVNTLGNRADGNFEPGDPVKISVEIDKSKLTHVNSNETFFAAISVTDVSAFLKVPKYK